MNTQKATPAQAEHIIKRIASYVRKQQREAAKPRTNAGYTAMLRADAAYNKAACAAFKTHNDLVRLRNELYAQDTLPREEVCAMLVNEELGITYKMLNEL